MLTLNVRVKNAKTNQELDTGDLRPVYNFNQ